MKSTYFPCEFPQEYPTRTQRKGTDALRRPSGSPVCSVSRQWRRLDWVGGKEGGQDVHRGIVPGVDTSRRSTRRVFTGARTGPPRRRATRGPSRGSGWTTTVRRSTGTGTRTSTTLGTGGSWEGSLSVDL